MRNSTRVGGFTLLELMIVVAVAAVILALGVPSFQSVINSGRISGAANELVAALQQARMEAVRTNRRVVLCRSDAPDAAAPSCVAGAGNWGGWISFVDADGNGALNGAEIVLRVGVVPPSTELSVSPAISGANNQIVVRPDGLARTGAGALLAARLRTCVPSTFPSENARDVVISAGSRVSTARVALAGVCGAPAN